MPRTTTLHPFRVASDSQRELIRTLEQERGLSPWVALNSPFLTFREASQRIDALRAMPRSNGPVPFGGTPEELPVPQGTTRTGRMILAGQVSATVTLPNGQHVTVFGRTLRRRTAADRMNRRTWIPCSLLEPGATMYVSAARRGRRIGRIGEGFAIRWQLGTTVEAKDAVRALFGFARAADSEGGYGAYRIQVADSCGRCGRELTDPESIDRGVGPDCWGQMTNSYHARVTDGRSQERNLRAMRQPDVGSSQSDGMSSVLQRGTSNPNGSGESGMGTLYLDETEAGPREGGDAFPARAMREVRRTRTRPAPSGRRSAEQPSGERRDSLSPMPYDNGRSSGGIAAADASPEESTPGFAGQVLSPVSRARDLIARALKYQSEDEGIDPSDVEFALSEFDRMARTR